MFSLIKAGDIWTLRYEVSPVWRILGIAAGVAGIAVGIMQSVGSHGFNPVTSTTILAVLLCLAVMGYWVISDAPTTAVFDLAQRRLSVHCERPWFGAPRSFAFADVAALHARNVSGESTDSWEARVEFRDGTRIRLGRESEGRNERIRGYLEEIRRAAGIPGK
jgi:hypothetical protein